LPACEEQTDGQTLDHSIYCTNLASCSKMCYGRDHRVDIRCASDLRPRPIWRRRVFKGLFTELNGCSQLGTCSQLVEFSSIQLTVWTRL